MTEHIIIAGSGGQGIMLLGKILATAAMREGKQVTWLPSYGAEVRGGAAFCMVVISDEEIGSPYVDEADTLIVMNEISLEKFQSRLKNKGLFIINSSLVHRKIKEDPRLLQFPFTDIAIRIGNIKIANMVTLGCYLSKRKILDIAHVVLTIEAIAPAGKRDLIEINKKALYSGFNLIK
jgi:2-oxoglutarate ferredoxin oxidoreductase subunit gamma